MYGLNYAMGSGDPEFARLTMQAGLVADFTQRLFRAAGLAPGMRVLDVGSGMGDTALVAAGIVGPAGRVVGIDRDPAVVAKANERVRGLDRVRFVTGTIEEYAEAQPFDAVVGRFVLFHQADPATAIRHAAALVRPGGVVAFAELDYSAWSVDRDCCFPHVEICHQHRAWLLAALGRAGVHLDMGLRMRQDFRRAGLPGSQVVCETMAAGGADMALLTLGVETLRTLAPVLEQHGIATRDEIGFDTLEQRMRDGVAHADSQILGPRCFGAWATAT